MKNFILPVLVLFAMSFTGCKKKEVDNTGKSHATLTNIYINYTSAVTTGSVVGYPVHFWPEASGASSYRWDFGDGKVSGDRYPDHIYNKDGSYKVKLKLDNDDSVTATISVYVAKIPTITATFAGTHLWRAVIKSHVADVDSIIAANINMEIKYVDPVTISFNNTKLYFQTLDDLGDRTVVKYRMRDMSMGGGSEFEMTVTHTAAKDSFYYSSSEAVSLGAYYSSTFISP
ncbi:MAG: hypothetical protein JWQ38_2003 [Flavipsychrobacter sp.]|nr:hypothetical protein [Flavipsychrobacter sp.]